MIPIPHLAQELIFLHPVTHAENYRFPTIPLLDLLAQGPAATMLWSGHGKRDALSKEVRRPRTSCVRRGGLQESSGSKNHQIFSRAIYIYTRVCVCVYIYIWLISSTYIYTYRAYAYIYIHIIWYYMHQYLPHKAVAEVSKITNYRKLVSLNHGSQSEWTDAPTSSWRQRTGD